MSRWKRPAAGASVWCFVGNDRPMAPSRRHASHASFGYSNRCTDSALRFRDPELLTRSTAALSSISWKALRSCPRTTRPARHTSSHPYWPPPSPARRALLHGDFWPGNVLWRDNRIVAVIDWEDAAVGDPLADVATTRLDLRFAFGSEAMRAFTDHYLALTAVDITNLPVWDLVAALRPAGGISAWAADWANFGRPDLTASGMRATHAEFLDAALAALVTFDP